MRTRSLVQGVVAASLLLVPARAWAVDAGSAGGKPIVLDVTETSIVAQHFDPRKLPNNTPIGPVTVEDSGWGEWINRINAALRWDRWTAGLRLDSSLYWRRPADNSAYQTQFKTFDSIVQRDNETRFQNSIYPAKLWITYAAPGVEVTAGDSYVQFGRGLTLSMRKIDELGIDTTVRGGKVEIESDPFAMTAVAGFANPSRVDEATGRALFVASNLVSGDPRTPTFGSDRVIGVDLQAGRGLPVTLSTHVVRFTRCAPYSWNGAGVDQTLATSPEADTFSTGTCNASDTDIWLGQSLNPTPRGLQAHDITMGGQSIEVPNLWGHGKLYVEGAVQQRQSDLPSLTALPYGPNGNALYAALTVDAGPTSTTFELKSNRNFYTVAASIGQSAPEFAIVAYSFLPPAESFNMLDAEGTGDFNACVNGGRLREDVSTSSDLMLYAQGAYAYSRTEQPSGGCDAQGRTVTPQNIAADTVQDVMYDGVGGFEYYFDSKLSHVFASAGVRDDTRRDGTLQYREQHAEYSVAKYLGGPWSLEVQGRERHRIEGGFNLASDGITPNWWSEGENYVALRMASKWVFSQGIEYTTLTGQPLLYFNGSVLYKLTAGSNVRVFVGESRGAFRCASGICR
ncbi:MAG: hypothetical protein ACRELB_09045, partial [Polyangiaceae bacterium]